MGKRRTKIVLAAMALIVALGVTYHTVAVAGSKKCPPPPEFLSEEHLQGSMQGKSGISIDLNGDKNEDLIIGAPYAQEKDTSGALLVYLATPRGFQKQASAVLHGTGNLGWSLAALGDLYGDGRGYFAAGSLTGSGRNASLSGTVTIYKGDRRLRKVAVLEGESAMDKFGFALASGDLNGDGYPDLIVGAPMHSPTPALYQQGAVYIYFGPGYVPTTAVKIPATSSVAGIGLCVASGDINGDGIDDLIVGASGKVVVYYGGKSFQPTSGIPDVVFNGKDSGFGLTIAALWDVNGDGFRDISVGAYKAAVSDVAETGRLYILSGGTGRRTVNADSDYLARIDGELNSGQFASAILPVKDVDGCGKPDLVVSAVHGDGTSRPMTGKIFFFSGRDMALSTTVASAKIIPGTARDMHLGSSLALVGGHWLAAGAPTEKANTGRVRLFNLVLVANKLANEE